MPPSHYNVSVDWQADSEKKYVIETGPTQTYTFPKTYTEQQMVDYAATREHILRTALTAVLEARTLFEARAAAEKGLKQK